MIWVVAYFAGMFGMHLFCGWKNRTSRSTFFTRRERSEMGFLWPIVIVFAAFAALSAGMMYVVDYLTERK